MKFCDNDDLAASIPRWLKSIKSDRWIRLTVGLYVLSKPYTGSLIQIKGASEALRGRLVDSADKNHRSLNQEALERLERSFEIEDALVSARDQKWINEAMAGEFRPGTVAPG